MSDVKSSSQFGTLYHGTSEHLSPGTNVRPSKPLNVPIPGTKELRATKIAFSTTDLDEAKAYAADRAQHEGRLFGHVYEVEPHPEDQVKSKHIPSFVTPKKYVTHVRSEKGFVVKKQVDWN